MKMFWSQDRKWVESDATAVDPAPHRDSRRMAKVAFAISIATWWAASRVR